MLTSLLLLAAASGPSADPLAPAREGKIQCILPNKEKKLCAGTTSYRIAPDGSYESTSKLLLAPTPLITMEVRTRGAIKDGKICEPVRIADFQAGTVYVNGAAADDATAGAVRGNLASAVAALDGKTACSAIKPADGGLLLNELAIDGAVRTDLSQKFIWVDAKEGYGLGM